ncbi:Cdc25 phosphatase Ibp1 [Gnomoniopsis sp. IMI 355080]|nr:Cdc25 phosphatase Ibp1 [Gnomoniopsis sp. IMI 355080]
MSRFTIATLPRMEVTALSEQLLALKAPDNSIAVVDVRDGDHIGGHIKGSKWVPSHQFDAQLPTLLRQLENTKTVVFHCALSKQRGPSAALQYIRAREAEHGAASIAAPDGESTEGKKENGDKGGEGESQKKPVAQHVCVLRGGFSKWQEAHGPDERLTEAYVKDLWEDY